MPYITKERIYELDEEDGLAETVGELTYAVTKACLDLIGNADMVMLPEAIATEVNTYLDNINEPKYADLCGVVGSLECARREYRRRRPDAYLEADEVLTTALSEFYATVVAPYEDTKIEQNGDVF